MRQLRLCFLLGLVVAGSLLLVGCGRATSSGRMTVHATAPVASVSIPRGQELFSPFIVRVQPDTIVTWQNHDTVAHTIMTTWDQSTFLNPQAFALHAAAGENVSFTFTKPGLYDYFDNSQATWDKTDDRVMAKKGVPDFPLSMEGIVWVQGHIGGLPSSATNAIPNGKDDFKTDFLAITVGGTVTWHNGDTDTHFLDAVYGWSRPINPVDIGPNQLKGTDEAPPNGGSFTLHFATPGLYYYYCSSHAAVNLQWHRASAQEDASESPIPMEGFVLVVGR